MPLRSMPWAGHAGQRPVPDHPDRLPRCEFRPDWSYRRLLPPRRHHAPDNQHARWPQQSAGQYIPARSHKRPASCHHAWYFNPWILPSMP